MKERIAIVGAGVMGRNHARTLAEFNDVSLEYIVDADQVKAESVAREFGDANTRALSDMTQLDMSTIDAGIIASPSRFHEEQAEQLIGAGKHVLIEKPVAESAESARKLAEQARLMGVVAIAGHIELFNPTIQSLMVLLADEVIKEMSFERLSTVPDRSRLYHDVVSDLMIHDISIALRILEKRGLITEGAVEASVGRKDTIATPDPARATLRFGDIDAHFRASRAYPAGKMRKATIETDKKIFTADLLSRSIQATSTNSIEFTADGVLAEDTSTMSYFPREAKQPLTLEQAFFLNCIRGKASPADMGVSLDQAARVLGYTEAILKSLH